MSRGGGIGGISGVAWGIMNGGGVAKLLVLRARGAVASERSPWVLGPVGCIIWLG